MKLYFSPGACSLSPHIVLRELGLPFELVRVDLRAKQLKAGGADYFEVNAKGMVPVLELAAGERLTEGPAIVQYLADQKASHDGAASGPKPRAPGEPEAGLIPPAGTMERYRLLEWLNYLSTELHKGFSPLFHPAAPEEWKKVVKQRLETQLEYVSKKLEGKTWVMGDAFTVADAYLYTILRWTKVVDISLASWPLLEQFMARAEARPAVAAALEAEKLKT